MMPLMKAQAGIKLGDLLAGIVDPDALLPVMGVMIGIMKGSTVVSRHPVTQHQPGRGRQCVLGGRGWIRDGHGHDCRRFRRSWLAMLISRVSG